MISLIRLSVLAACAALAPQARAITAAELSQKLAAGEVLRLIDLRPKARYDAGTIPGAMNIPAAVILEKKLPALSGVVLFDDGLGGVDVPAIATALNQRPGWKAETLEGGFAGWQALSNAPQTSPAGLRGEDIQHITYERLAALKESVVLVDVRPPQEGQPAKGASPLVLGRKPASPSAPNPVSGFCAKSANRSYQHSLDQLRKQHRSVSRHPSKSAGTKGAHPAGTPTPPLIVLVGAVNADHLETVRRLHAEGYPRVLILAGGDEAILLEGRRGKGHTSGSIQQGPVPDTTNPQPSTP